MPKKPNAGIFKWFLAVLPDQKQLCIFLKKKYDFQIACFKKTVESAHMPEFKKSKDVLLKTKDSLLKSKDGLLKTEDVLLKTKDRCTFFLWESL